MSEADIIKILIACQAGLLGMFVWHLFRCRDVRIDIATIRGVLERMAADIGSHETGLRGQVHDQQNQLLRIDGRVAALERRGDER